MKTLLQGLLGLGVVIALTGCGGMTGTWKMYSIEPQDAKGAFPLQTLCLHKDHTYCAYMACGTGINGKWEYDHQTKLITFIPEKGAQRCYKAWTDGMRNCLLVQSSEEGKEWKATMKRGKCDLPCCSKEAKCEPQKCQPQKCQPQKPEPQEASYKQKQKETSGKRGAPSKRS
mgnify:CR=1 FL=1